ncbi:MAG: protein-L-isoaspartate(D-aspartate) O-methyltransferase [Bacteroidetes bacterium]|nr:MAG: protein-L-isoaspartate(D-aspartate) O-methyltransferase [Bacteroidota bacterium]
MEDNYRHKGLRKKLVEEIRAKGITGENVLQALEKVPRHVFMDNAFLGFAYQDKAFPIGSGQTISQPYTVAFQSQLLEITKGDKVLEIGTGSGYQTAVLLELGAKVYTIERQKALYDKTRQMLPAIGYDPKFFYGDGYKGLPAFAPFDKILVTAGAPFVPQPLLDQLKPGGRLVIPVGSGDVQVMTLFIKKHDLSLEKHEFGSFKFVPLLTEREWK